jgi:hypothetical protein
VVGKAMRATFQRSTSVVQTNPNPPKP